MCKKGPTKPPIPKSTKAPSAKEKSEKPQASQEDIARQQRILDIFSASLSEVLSSDTFTSTLQEVKQGLFNRDFAGAFGTEEKLEVYASRWSPSRALCYASVLSSIGSYLDGVYTSSSEAGCGEDSRAVLKTLKMLCVGGGAAEMVAFAAYLKETNDLAGELILLDSAPWSEVVLKLEKGLTTALPLSKYASEAIKAANVPLVEPSRVSSRFILQDILELEKSQLCAVVGLSPCLVTLLFTLNELFTLGGIGKTTRFLLDLTSVVPIGSLLLVVDSPGSYSEATVGKQAKRYPMQWLLNKVLQGTEADPVEGRRWTRLESNDSLWFRLVESLNYPIPLENMRYQMHLYRAEAAGS